MPSPNGLSTTTKLLENKNKNIANASNFKRGEFSAGGSVKRKTHGQAQLVRGCSVGFVLVLPPAPSCSPAELGKTILPRITRLG